MRVRERLQDGCGVVERPKVVLPEGVHDDVMETASCEYKAAGAFAFITGDQGIKKIEDIDSTDHSGELDLNSCLSEDPALAEAFNEFDNLVRELGLEDADFFKSPFLREYFIEQLKYFILYLNEKLSAIKEFLARLGDISYKKLSKNWERNMRKVAYTAFFIHFGQMRKAEKDSHGRPKAYVRHVMRTAFNAQMRKLMVFHEAYNVAALLHDSKEDFRKGMASILFLKADDRVLTVKDLEGEKRVNAQKRLKEEKEVADGFLRFIDGILDVAHEDMGSEFEDEISPAVLVDIVTKVSDDRAEAFLGMLRKIIDTGDINAFLVVLWEKFPDRIDNLTTFSGSKSAKEIEDETYYLFLAFASYFRSVNAADWVLDYVAMQEDPAKYRHMNKVLREADREEIVEGFREEFQRNLSAFAGREVLEGRDYVLEFRQVGHRFWRDDRIPALTSSRGVKQMRHFLIFHPIGEANEGLEVQAKEVFEDLFPSVDLDRDIGLIFCNCKLARVITTLYKPDGTLIEKSERKGGFGSDEKYGLGAWGVFSEREAVRCLLGELALFYFYGDKRVEEKLECFVAQVVNFIGQMEYLYTLVKGHPDEVKLRKILQRMLLMIFITEPDGTDQKLEYRKYKVELEEEEVREVFLPERIAKLINKYPYLPLIFSGLMFNSNQRFELVSCEGDRAIYKLETEGVGVFDVDISRMLEGILQGHKDRMLGRELFNSHRAANISP